MAEARPIWVDVDTGVDDALALLVLARHPAVQLVGVSAVAGNVDVDLALANTAAVLDAGGASPVPLHRGAASPLLGPHRGATGYHGVSGLGDVRLPASSRPVSPVPAAVALADAAERHPGLTVLALGPLTNLALLAALRPDAAASLGGILVMGGALGPGNATAVAEYNTWQDPEAAQIVLESPAPVTLYPLDLFSRVGVHEEEIVSLERTGSPAGTTAAALLRHDPGADGFALLGDAGAACALLRPELLRTEDLAVEVSLAPGITRGALIADRRGFDGEHEEHGGPGLRGRASVVVDADAAALAEEFLAAVRRG
ncbi:nucleoside hydrolase [Naasia sp. SYSU D00057]|uniref:nucleoside hydrolase n=1 Tax=Naasia sp. SYSU D00057 TaxID=2817380 RepID=UPI001B30AAEB|nr:nucleoside hydrolase [Naasia sp. SYSU D00057]